MKDIKNIERCNCNECEGKKDYIQLPSLKQSSALSITPTPWAVWCNLHGKQYLTSHDYNQQMNSANSLWKCPICRSTSQWDDDNYEQYCDDYEDDTERMLE